MGYNVTCDVTLCQYEQFKNVKDYGIEGAWVTECVFRP